MEGVALDDVSLEDKCCWICKETCHVVHNYCKCKGDNKIVHKACLEEWINTDAGKNKICVICDTPYNLKPCHKKLLKWRCYKRDCSDNLLLNIPLCFAVSGVSAYILISSEFMKLIASEETSKFTKMFLVPSFLGPFIITALIVLRTCLDCRDYAVATRKRNTIHTLQELDDVKEATEDDDEYVDAVEEIVVESPT
ncbi:m153L [Myxoma virus]|nr:m153L [Myxoma virus]